MRATFRDIERISRPLVDGDPRLAFVRRAIVLRPVGHWLHGFSFVTYHPRDQVPFTTRPRLNLTPSNWEGLFWPRVLFQPLYVPARRVNPGFGRALHCPWDLDDWRVTTPGIAGIFREVATDAIDSILNIDTPDKFGIWSAHAGSDGWPSNENLAECLTHALAGRLGVAIRSAEYRFDNWDSRDQPATPAQARRLRRLIRVFQAGQARTNRLLRTFEWITARHLGAARWWTWTPAVE